METEWEEFLFLSDLEGILSSVERFSQRIKRTGKLSCPDCKREDVYKITTPFDDGATTEAHTSTKYYSCGDCSLSYYNGKDPYA